MWIDWHNFTPWAALLGGALIGIAAALLVLLNGRVAGICGILSGLILPLPSDASWRLAFVIGLILSPWIWQGFGPLPTPLIETDYPLLAVAGLLVGLGTRYGSGCTSGHGVCGISRRSPRSVAATLAFMLGGFATVFVVRHLWGF